MKYTGAKILIESLKRMGTQCVFGYPGGSILDIYEELYKEKGKIKHYLMSSEQGATFAADGYSLLLLYRLCRGSPCMEYRCIG